MPGGLSMRVQGVHLQKEVIVVEGPSDSRNARFGIMYRLNQLNNEPTI